MISSTAFYDVVFKQHFNAQIELSHYERQILTEIDEIIDDSYNLNRHIPILPGVFNELWAELNCQHTDFNAISVILKKDPILKARVLALVNSAYYKRTKKQITEIETAIQMVGLDTINSLFVSFIVKGMIKLNPQHYKLFGHFIWRHLLETAVISQRIAGEYEAKNPFLCYLTGLIHDLGKVIIFLCKSQQWQDQLSLKHLGSDAFKRALTERSLKLSRYIVEDWPLPAELVYAVNSYHQPQQTEPYAQVLQIANRTSELHMQIKAKIINLDTANEHLIISGLTQAQSQQCLKAMENIPPL